MSEFRQFVCWTDEGVIKSTPRDAASLSPGHFRAVHHPLGPKKRRLEARSGGALVDESEIIRVLQGPLREDGYLLIPVVGGSGTGKSHLVRWVYEHTLDREDWTVRYLAKNRTSIRQVIEIVIDGMQGPAVDAAREALESAPGHTESEEVLAERLLDELALITSREGQMSSELDKHSQQLLAKLRGELPDVLRDPVIRRRLTADGAVIPRLVGLAMRGRRNDDGFDDDAIRISEEDLPRSFEEIDHVSRGARELLGQLATISELATAAINLINEALPSAVKRVFVSSQVDLIEVFRDIRKALLADKKDLVLFIEDLTVLHGVEREFLDAIVEPASSPHGELCKLRILFAVTEHHFDGLDTVRTRCDDAYWLDTRYGSEGIDSNEAASFLGRYLNASRLDPTQLESEWSNSNSSVQISNACDECSFRIDCHESFGVSAEGFGLYPFNLTAIDKLVASLSPDRFDPRLIVRELVYRFLLISRNDIPRGEFPSDDLLEAFDKESDPLDNLTVTELQTKRPNDYKRLVNALRYWSEDDLQIGDAILDAFGAAPFEGVESKEPPTPPRRKSQSKREQATENPDVPDGELSVEHRLQSQSRKVYDALTRWSGNQQDLGAPATNHLRKLIHKAIIQNLDFGPLPVNLDREFESTRFKERDIYIVGTVSHQGDRDQATIVIEQDSATASALQGLILLAELPDAEYPREDRFRQEAAKYLEEWTGKARSSLEQAPPPSVVAAVQGILLCSAILGNCENLIEANDYLRALFVRPKQGSDHQRGQKWQSLTIEAKDAYTRLRPTIDTYFGEARGTGLARAIRADLLLEIIQEFTKGWELMSTDPTIDRLMRLVSPALDDEWGLLKERVEGVAPLLDPDRGWKEQTSRVMELIEAAHRGGRLNDPDAMSELNSLIEQTEDNSHRFLFRGAELIATDLPLGERLGIAAGQLPSETRNVSRFATKAQQIMDAISSDLDERKSDEAEDDDLEDIVHGVLAATMRLEDAAKAISP